MANAIIQARIGTVRYCVHTHQYTNSNAKGYQSLSTLVIIGRSRLYMGFWITSRHRLKCYIRARTSVAGTPMIHTSNRRIKSPYETAGMDNAALIQSNCVCAFKYASSPFGSTNPMALHSSSSTPCGSQVVRSRSPMPGRSRPYW